MLLRSLLLRCHTYRSFWMGMSQIIRFALSSRLTLLPVHRNAVSRTQHRNSGHRNRYDALHILIIHDYLLHRRAILLRDRPHHHGRHFRRRNDRRCCYQSERYQWLRQPDIPSRSLRR